MISGEEQPSEVLTMTVVSDSSDQPSKKMVLMFKRNIFRRSRLYATMHPLLQAILWNNEGARLVQLGELHDATFRIHHAALVIENALMPPLPAKSANGCCTVHVNDDDLSKAEPSLQQRKVYALGHEQECVRRFQQQLSNSVNSVYQHPIVLSTDMIIDSAEDSAARVMQTVHGAILFNLALTSHLSGLATTADAEDLFDHALELYHCSLGLVDSEGSNGSGKNYGNPIWACYILNNMAHIYKELGECNESLYYMNSLEELVAQSDSLDEKIRSVNDTCDGR
jgi:tetratricopeptide (TPR) repeat protein